MRDHGFDSLWAVSSGDSGCFDPATVSDLPTVVRRYLMHSVAAGATAATAVRLRMHGEIKLSQLWRPFVAEEVIRWHRGFVWRARMKMNGLPVIGSDRWIDGQGSMRWRLLGVLPVVSCESPDVSRSGLGRVQAEAIWLPTALLLPAANWNVLDESAMTVQVPFAEHQAQVTLQVETDGRLRTATIARWGNPDEKTWGEHAFGGECFEERTFNGISIPTKLRIGWYFGTSRFETEGEFFRVTVDSAEFR